MSKNVSLMFYYAELFDDIKACAYVEASSLPEDTATARRLVFDVAEEGFRVRVMKMAEMAIAECRDLIYAYITKGDAKGCSNDFTEWNTSNFDDSISIRLSLPDGVDMSSVDFLTKLIHEYVVCRSLEDWLSMTVTARADVWKTKQEDVKRKIKRCITKRKDRARLRMSPF